MTAERRSLLARVSDLLADHRIRYALIGASAMAIHGVSRSTVDIDLLVTDTRVLSPDLWAPLPSGVGVDIRPGDADDPLAGVVRLRAEDERDVDLIVARGRWEAGVVARATPTPYAGVSVPAVQVADLILLKLYAGGSQDRWDVEQLLARPDRDEIVQQVDARLPDLPAEARSLWDRLQ